MVERGGRARSFHVPEVNAKTLEPILHEQIDKTSQVMTDDAGQYKHLAKHFAAHGIVRHGIGEYVRGDVHTNVIENYYSLLKSGLHGVYQHCAKKHLQRYVGNFDFRYNHREKLGYDDARRASMVLKGIADKRLTYTTPGSA